MNSTRVPKSGRRRTLQQGYSMIELSVALVIALFLLNGMFTILQSTRKTSGNQNLLAQLQDEERVAMTMMTDVIQQAGYFSGAQTTLATAEFLPSTTFSTAGQSVAGGTNTYGDTVSVRYQGDTSTGGVLDCVGNSIANGTIEEMTFSVNVGTNNNGQPGLYCTINGVAAPLVPNVKTIAVSYGVDANASGSANTYLTAAQTTAAGLWTSVYSVKINVTFLNPLFGQPGQTNQTISFTRAIGIMRNSGVNVLNFY
jgi:type IV pilus assembly protein PilW